MRSTRMYYKSRCLKTFAIILLLFINATLVWFVQTDTFCGDTGLSNAETIHRRESPFPYNNLASRHEEAINDDLDLLHNYLEIFHQAINSTKDYQSALNKLLHYAGKKSNKNVPTIYCITPTYARLTQKADLTRLCQTLQHVWNFHWIVVEDSKHKTDLVSRLLKRCGVTYTHLAVRTSAYLRRKDKTPRWRFPRGMEQRNKGLEWVRRNFDPGRMEGVVYFGDDDNTYDVEIFDRMRHTKAVSIWPVGFVGGLRWEGPICKNNTVVAFRVAFKPNRAIPIDMAGFAVNAKLVANNPRLKFYPKTVAVGHSESDFLQMITARDKLETLGDSCNKVLVWHTRTSREKLHREVTLKGKFFPNLEL